MYLGLTAALTCALAAMAFLWRSFGGTRRQRTADVAELGELDAYVQQLADLAARGQELFERASIGTAQDQALLARINEFELEVDRAQNLAGQKLPDRLLTHCDVQPERLFRDLRDAGAAIRQFHAAENRHVEGELFHIEARRASALLAQLRLDLQSADARIRQKQQMSA